MPTRLSPRFLRARTVTHSESDHHDSAGDRTKAFLHLLSEHDRALYAYILALVPNVAEVQDIAQEVRLRLWDQFDKFEPGSNFGAWSRSIAHFLILAHRKTSSREHARFSEAFLELVAQEVAETVDELPHRQTATTRQNYCRLVCRPVF